MKFFRVKKNEKQPLITDWRKGEYDTIVQSWINEGGNIGVLTGDVSGILVVDCDNHKPNQLTGVEHLKQYTKDHEVELPETWSVSTPSGGLHLYYSIPEEWKGKSFHQQIKAIESVDFQHNGRYVVYAGSQIDGNLYQNVRDVPIVPAPEWLLKLYHKPEVKHSHRRKPNKSAQVINFMTNGVSEGGRNIWIAQLTGKLLATGATDEAVAKMVVLANKEFVKPPLDNAELKQTFQSVLRADKRKRK